MTMSVYPLAERGATLSFSLGPGLLREVVEGTQISQGTLMSLLCWMGGCIKPSMNNDN